jgi:hypothetical protein
VVFLVFIGCKKQEQVHITSTIPNSLREVFSSLSKTTLQNLNPQTKRQIADRIVLYFNRRVNVNVREQLGYDDDGVILTGMICAAASSPDPQVQAMRTTINFTPVLPPLDIYASNSWGCFIAAVGGILNLADAKSIWQGLVNVGLNSKTVISAVTVIAKRASVGIQLGFTVLGFVNCMGWLDIVAVYDPNDPLKPTFFDSTRLPLTLITEE